MNYISRRTPRVKQQEALDFIADKRVAALLMGMRTGKTKVIIDDWGKRVLRSEVADLLVIAPGGSYLPWRDELTTDLPPSVANNLIVYTWVSRTAVKDKRQLEQFLQPSSSYRVLLINFEAISSIKKVRELCLRFVTSRCMCVVDESVGIKNRDSILGKFCVDELSALTFHKRIMTGLVSPQSPLDVYQQFRFLDKKIFPESFTEFRDRYAEVHRICSLSKNVIQNKFESVFGLRNKAIPDAELRRIAKVMWPDGKTESWNEKFLRATVYAAAYTMTNSQMVDTIFRAGRFIQSIPLIKGYKNVEELHARIAPYSFRVRLEDCYDMPEASYSFHDVEMTQKQHELYYDMVEFATAKLAEQKHVTASNVITQILRLHQILCGHTQDEDGDRHEIPENRTSSLVNLLEDYEGKAVIWCSYDADVRKVSEALQKRFGRGSVARFWGGNVQTREDEEVLFKSSDACRFQIATPDAGGKGRTWAVANLSIYYSCRNNLDHRAQSEDRVKAVGKKTPVAYIDMRCPGTVEDKIIAALKRKVDLANIINGDDFRDWIQ